MVLISFKSQWLNKIFFQKTCGIDLQFNASWSTKKRLNESSDDLSKIGYNNQEKFRKLFYMSNLLSLRISILILLHIKDFSKMYIIPICKFFICEYLYHYLYHYIGIQMWARSRQHFEFQGPVVSAILLKLWVSISSYVQQD